jgi:cellulose synthase/poly-beta-1,6-N-acetylglucosamine synthase-like glycosyltransferase
MNTLLEALVQFEWAVLAYFAVVNGWTLMLLVGATLEMRRHAGLQRDERWRLPGSPLAPSITVLAPVRNEMESVIDRVAALLALHHRNLEVVVVDDGSSDCTLDVMREHFHLVGVHPIYRRSIVTAPVRALYRSAVYPNLVVVDKVHGGKADALNAGLNVAMGELVCAIDAGTLVENEALQRMVRPFLERDDVLATGGTIRIANGCVVRNGRVADARVPRQPLAAFQVIEYLRTYLFGRLGWNRLGGNIVMSGAFGLFRREAVIDVGGYAHDTVVEDMELVLRLRRRGHETGGPHRVVFVPDPVAWTLAPTSTPALGRERERWHRGLADALWRHRAVLMHARYGALGLVVFPFVLVMELFAPVVELLGVLGLALGLSLGVLDGAFAGLFLIVAYALGAVLTVFTLVMDELSFARYTRLSDRARLVFWALIEPIGYRQLTVFWRLQGLERWLRRRRVHGHVPGKGHASGDGAEPVRGAA